MNVTTFKKSLGLLLTISCLLAYSLVGLQSIASSAEEKVLPNKILPEIVVVGNAAFVLKDDGRVWIYDYLNADESMGENQIHPFFVSASHAVLALESGKEYAYALLDNGNVYRIGKNGISARLHELESVSAISAKGDTLLFVKNKKVYTSDASGENIKQISDANDVADVSLGEGKAVLINSQGSIFHATLEYGNWAVEENPIRGLPEIKHVSNGSLALDKDGKVWNVNKETEDTLELSRTEKISSGKIFSLILDVNGQVFALNELAGKIILELNDKAVAVGVGNHIGAVLLANGRVEWVTGNEDSIQSSSFSSVKERMLKTSRSVNDDVQGGSSSDAPSFMFLSSTSGNQVPFPSDLSPMVHLKADEGIVTDANGKVSEWRDVSGNNKHFTQSSSSMRPAVSSRSEYPAIKGDGTLMAWTFVFDYNADIIIVFKRYNYGGDFILGSRDYLGLNLTYGETYTMKLPGWRSVYLPEESRDWYRYPWPMEKNVMHASLSPHDYSNQSVELLSNGNLKKKEIVSRYNIGALSQFFLQWGGADIDVFEVIVFKELGYNAKKKLYRYLSGKYGIQELPPMLASNLQCKSFSANSVRLSWNGEEGAKYIVERRYGSESYEVIGNVNNLYFIDNNVQSGQRYYYRVIRDCVAHNEHRDAYGYFSAYSKCVDSSAELEYTHTAISIPTSAIAFWVKADAGVTVDSNGRVTGLSEQSKNGAILNRNNAGYIYWDAKAANGLPSFVLDGSPAYFSGYTTIPNGKQAEAFIVLKNRGGVANDIFNAKIGYNKYPNAKGNIEEQYGRYGSGSNGAPVCMAVPRETPLDDWRVYNVSVGGGTWQAYLDDVLLYRESYTPEYDFSVGLVSFGNEGYNSGLRGNIAETILFERKLTDSERSSVRNYLIGKYGLQKLKLTVPSEVESSSSTIKGKNYSGASGKVIEIGVDGVMLVERQGWLEYTFNVSQTGYYMFKVLTTIVDNMPGNSPYDIEILVDGISRERFIGEGKSLTLQSFMGLRAGSHTMRIKFSNPVHDRTFQINNISISGLFNSIEDTDWLSLRNTISNPVSVSKVSPYCMEGKGDWSLVSVQGYGDEIPAMQQLKGKWYADVSLSPSEDTNVVVSFDDGVYSKTQKITWTPTNVYVEHGRYINLRAGDSLRITAYKETTPQGKPITVTIGIKNYQTTDDKPIAYKFVYGETVSVRLSTGETVSCQPNVQDVYFNNPVSVVAGGNEVIFPCGGSYADAVFEGDTPLILRRKTSPPGLWVSSELDGEYKVLARLGVDGPIMAVETVNAALLHTSSGTLQVKVSARLMSGKYLIYIRIQAGNLPEGAYVGIAANNILAFEDGDTYKRFYADSFSEDGYLDIYMISEYKSWCHTVILYDKDGNVLRHW